MSNKITIVEPQVSLITPVSHLNDYAKLIEVAARTCYKSEGKIKKGSDKRIINILMKKGHLSVLEHCNVTYRFTCSRATSHQLVRHRIAAFSQESQRYCDYGDKGFQIIMPPSIKTRSTKDQQRWLTAKEFAYEEYLYWRNNKIPPEDARYELPNAAKTEVVTTFNLRMWRHVIKERGLNKHAQWEIRNLMLMVLAELNQYLPVFFTDLMPKKKSSDA